ncbi:hypothetical protein PR048_032232 [Dryococelus australis]|uniref:Uncharacterized protein n=1 Tax=Dryococelus australis TaxID=614101 RepID=A0ABQ9G1N4_9NEOP|nr:hypothetical protein PR048_032232 [Dryococelus australis]
MKYGIALHAITRGLFIFPLGWREEGEGGGDAGRLKGEKAVLNACLFNYAGGHQPIIAGRESSGVRSIEGYYAVVRRQQYSPIGLARPEPRPQPYRTSLGRIGSPGEGSSGAAIIHCSTHGMVARGMATNPRGCPANTRREHARQGGCCYSRKRWPYEILTGKLNTTSVYIRQKAKSKYRSRIRLERASQNQSGEANETPYTRAKRCRERKKKKKKHQGVRARQRRRIRAKQTAVETAVVFHSGVAVPVDLGNVVDGYTLNGLLKLGGASIFSTRGVLAGWEGQDYNTGRGGGWWLQILRTGLKDETAVVEDTAAPGTKGSRGLRKVSAPFVVHAKLRKLNTISAYIPQKAKSKYRKRIRLERASHKLISIDTHKTQYDRVKPCWEGKKKTSRRKRRRIHAKHTGFTDWGLAIQQLCVAGRGKRRRFFRRWGMWLTSLGTERTLGRWPESGTRFRRDYEWRCRGVHRDIRAKSMRAHEMTSPLFNLHSSILSAHLCSSRATPINEEYVDGLAHEGPPSRGSREECKFSPFSERWLQLGEFKFKLEGLSLPGGRDRKLEGGTYIIILKDDLYRWLLSAWFRIFIPPPSSSLLRLLIRTSKKERKKGGEVGASYEGGEIFPATASLLQGGEPRVAPRQASRRFKDAYRRQACPFRRKRARSFPTLPFHFFASHPKPSSRPHFFLHAAGLISLDLSEHPPPSSTFGPPGWRRGALSITPLRRRHQLPTPDTSASGPWSAVRDVSTPMPSRVPGLFHEPALSFLKARRRSATAGHTHLQFLLRGAFRNPLAKGIDEGGGRSKDRIHFKNFVVAPRGSSFRAQKVLMGLVVSDLRVLCEWRQED